LAFLQLVIFELLAHIEQAQTLLHTTLNVKIAAKPLKIETWLLLTAYEKSQAP